MADKLSRRKVLSSFGLTGLGLLASNVQAGTSNSISLIKEGENILFYSSLTELKESTVLKVGNVVQTGGYYQIGDGGQGIYIIRASASELLPDGGGIIGLKKNLVAALINVREVNYK